MGGLLVPNARELRKKQNDLGNEMGNKPMGKTDKLQTLLMAVAFGMLMFSSIGTDFSYIVLVSGMLAFGVGWKLGRTSPYTERDREL